VNDAKATIAGAVSLLRVGLWGVPALLILLATVSLPEAGRSWPARVGRRLGDASYSVYLVHLPVLLVLQGLLKRAPVALPGPAVVLLSVAVGLAAGAVFFVFVERPVTRALTARRTGRGGAAATAAA
jgi:exopolysaccharide production protein ExoZ